MTEERATVLRLQRLGMRYGASEEVLHDLDLTLTAGSFHFLVGPSGAGKTTLMRVLSLSHPATRGTIMLFGRDVSRLERSEAAALRRRLGVVFQDIRLLDHLTAFDNLALPLRIDGASDERISAHVSELLRWLGLGEVMERHPSELSMGQRQLLAVGRAVINRPGLLLADEPMSHLDPRRAERLMNLFVHLHRTGTAVLLATHSQDLVRRHCFPVLRMERGRLFGAPALMAGGR